MQEEALRDPRPDEGLDEARLADYLRGKLDGAEQPMRVLQFTGGLANLTYLLRFGEDREYVLRRPPLGHYAPTAHDMSREYRALSAIHPVFSYAPRVYLYVEDESVVGAPFIIMERRKGTVVRRVMPRHYLRFPDAPRMLSEALVDALAAFHKVDYAGIGLSRLGRSKGYLTRQVEGWNRRWQAAKVDENPDVDALYDWLSANMPASPKPALVHNDYKLDNTIFASDDPSRMIALLDWDMCTLGDPLLDLATLLTYWTERDDPPSLRSLSPMPQGDFAFLTRRQISERYALQSGLDIGDIRFYQVLALFRWMVFLQQMHYRYARGMTQDPRFKHLNRTAELLAKTAFQASRGQFQ